MSTDGIALNRVVLNIQQAGRAAGDTAACLPCCSVEMPHVPKVARASEANVDRAQCRIGWIDSDVPDQAAQSQRPACGIVQTRRRPANGALIQAKNAS